MAGSVFCLLLSLLLISSYTHVESYEEGFILADISDKGLDFIKDLLIEKAESSLVPLELPTIERTVRIPVIGRARLVLSNITLFKVNVTASTVKPGDTGLVIAVSGATANLTMNWGYSYSTWLLPIAISDSGEATVQVEGMQVGLTVSLKNDQSSLRLSVLDCGCFVEDISIKLDGGASWLYQGLVDAFENRISSAVEDAISKKLNDAIVKLDSLLQSVPKEVSVTDIAALNVTFLGDPLLSNSSLDLEIKGLFQSKDEILFATYYNKEVLALPSCKSLEKMVSISLHENVLNSASSVYFEAGKLHWIIDKVPDQSLLNTAGWRFIIPQLYKQYPNQDMNLNVSITSLPNIRIEKQQINVAIPSDVVIDVLKDGEVIPVVCISMVVKASATAEISRNSIAGNVRLDGFTMSLKWSEIGNLHMFLVQTIMSTLIRTVVLPYLNVQLRKGVLVPSFHGYGLANAQIQYGDSWITICSDVAALQQKSLN